MQGVAYYLRDGQLKFRDSIRQRSDVYVDPQGAVWWNGADSRRYAMHKPGENVQFVKPYIAAMKGGA